MSSEIILNNFHPQAYLIYLLSGAPKTLKESRLSPGTSATGVHKLQGPYRPEAVMSKIYNARDASGKKLIKAHFFNLETHKISALVPELRFFKAQNAANDAQARLTPFFFPVSTISDEAATTSGHSRTKGAGIKSFDVKFTGTDPFTAPRFLEASLSLYVDNLANLFDVEKGYAPLADLFTISIAKSAKKKEINGSTVTSGDLVRPVEVAATLGYAVPDTRLFTQEEIKEIRDSNISLRMNVVHHSINVNQDGSANIDIQYTARINNAGRDRIFSTTDSPVDLLKRANIRQMFSPEKKKLDSTKKKQSDDQAQKSIRKTQIQKSIEIRKLMNILERNKKIYFIDTDEPTLKSYTELGITLNQRVATGAQKFVNSALGAIGIPADDLKLFPGSEDLTKMLEDLDSSKRRVYYVTFGDLIEAFFEKTREGLDDALITLQKSAKIPPYIDIKSPEADKLAADVGIDKEELNNLVTIAKKTTDEKKKIAKVLTGAKKQLSNYRMLLPDIEFKSYVQPDNSEETTRINIADIPVSIETYQEFMFDKIVNSYRNTYTIPQFVNDCVSTLLPNIFGRSWSNVGIASKVISAQPTFTSTTYSGPRMRQALASQAAMSPEVVPSGQKDFRATKIDDESEYFVIYQKVDRELAPDGSGNLDKDSREGIYHFLLGKNRGLIKEINFSRFDVPYAQEQLMTNQVGLYDELKMPYNANITMVGNNLFMPGSQIYINPNNIGFGSADDVNSPAFRIGLGGYYTVLNVSTKFDGAGSLTTSIECSFGSHASEAEGLSNAAPKPKPLGNMKRTEASNDDVPGEIPDLDTTLVEVSQSHYLSQLVELKDPSTGRNILDENTARRVSNDFILHQDSNVVSIPGVVDKEINPQTGGVRYNLIRGEVIEIDESRPSNEAVRLVSSTQFRKTPTRGEG
jgi:hypothetical protein